MDWEVKYVDIATTSQHRVDYLPRRLRGAVGDVGAGYSHSDQAFGHFDEAHGFQIASRYGRLVLALAAPGARRFFTTDVLSPVPFKGFRKGRATSTYQSTLTPPLLYPILVSMRMWTMLEDS